MGNDRDDKMTRSEPAVSNALAATDQARAIAEVQAAMAIAKRFPRDHQQALDRILTACKRQALAADALYEYARAGTEITGPSIRLAEAIAQNWGNIQFGLRELEQRNGESTVEAFAWDLETNTRQNRVFQVPHIRKTKRGSYTLDDPRDVYETVANQGARRMRACILAVIPGDVTDAATDECDLTLRTKIKVTPETIGTMIDAYAKIGVSREQIAAKIQRSVETMKPIHVVRLRKIYASIKDGMSAPGDWFEGAPANGDADTGDDKDKKESRSEKMKADIASKANTDKPATEPEPPRSSSPVGPGAFASDDTEKTPLTGPKAARKAAEPAQDKPAEQAPLDFDPATGEVHPDAEPTDRDLGLDKPPDPDTA